MDYYVFFYYKTGIVITVYINNVLITGPLK